MIEDIMLFTLGCCSAALLSLLFLPVVWFRARRFAERRAATLGPTMTSEGAAERDGLRAKAAVAAVRLEQRVEAAELARAETAAELGRRTAALVEAERLYAQAANEATTSAASLEVANASLAEARSRVADLEAATKKQAEQIELADREHTIRLARQEELEAVVATQRSTIAGLETRQEGMDSRLEDLQREIGDLKRRHVLMEGEAADVARERDLARSDVLRGIEQRTMLHGHLKTENRRFEEQSSRLLARTEALAKAERRIMEQDAELRASAGAMAELKQRFDRLEARLIETAGTGKPVPDEEAAALRRSVAEIADETLSVLATPKAAPAKRRRPSRRKVAATTPS